MIVDAEISSEVAARIAPVLEWIESEWEVAYLARDAHHLVLGRPRGLRLRFEADTIVCSGSMEIHALDRLANQISKQHGIFWYGSECQDGMMDRTYREGGVKYTPLLDVMAAFEAQKETMSMLESQCQWSKASMVLPGRYAMLEVRLPTLLEDENILSREKSHSFLAFRSDLFEWYQIWRSKGDQPSMGVYDTSKQREAGVYMRCLDGRVSASVPAERPLPVQSALDSAVSTRLEAVYPCVLHDELETVASEDPTAVFEPQKSGMAMSQLSWPHAPAPTDRSWSVDPALLQRALEVVMTDELLSVELELEEDGSVAVCGYHPERPASEPEKVPLVRHKVFPKSAES
ncbi:MAG: hypothetical protein ABEN55_03885 [Bradymonadaceae bacterium]